MGISYSRLEHITYKVSMDNAGLLLGDGLSTHIASILANN
jgi:hypothetical protein